MTLRLLFQIFKIVNPSSLSPRPEAQTQILKVVLKAEFYLSRKEGNLI